MRSSDLRSDVCSSDLSEQCSPPIRARIRDRPGRAEGSSLQSSGALSAVVVAVMTKILSVCRRSRGNGREQAEPDRPGAQRDQDDAGKDREPSGERGEAVEKSPCGRSEEGRGGKEGVGRGRSRGAPYN